MTGRELGEGLISHASLRCAGNGLTGPTIEAKNVDAVAALQVISEHPSEDSHPDNSDNDQCESFVHNAPSILATVASFQSRVQPWMMACFGEIIAGDREERNHRFLEEALELVQSTGCTAHEAYQLVDYVYGRNIGEPHQEVGGVMVTLAALCLANDLDMHDAAEVELARIWTKVAAIRAKQAAKPKHSPLPGPTTLESRNDG